MWGEIFPFRTYSLLSDGFGEVLGSFVFDFVAGEIQGDDRLSNNSHGQVKQNERTLFS